MGGLNAYYSQCRTILCLAAKRRETISYARLAAALGLKHPKQRWSALLGPLATDETQKTGRDLTLVVVLQKDSADISVMCGVVKLHKATC